MARLPQPGSDNGTWGVLLNDFLSVAHTTTGTLADGIVTTSSIADTAVTTTKLSSGVQASLGKADTALQSATKATVGLANVDNTSDLSKPISTLTQTALDLKLTATSLDSATAALVAGSSSTASAITTKINTATAGTTSIYILAPADPDPTTGSPAGLYFRRTT